MAEVEELEGFLCFFSLARATPITVRRCSTDANASSIGVVPDGGGSLMEEGVGFL